VTYEVFVTDKAGGQLLEAARWWAEHRSVKQAKRWYDGFVAAFESLQEKPEHCALARENDNFPVTIRELHYGLASKPTHRAIFVVRPDRVVVYSIRHLAQRDITADDLY
jgi:plasmid stabilization system protein ParE